MFESQYYHCSFTGGETEAPRSLSPARAHQVKSGQKS